MWVDTIGNSTYWRQVSKTVTLYGGASESITVDGNTLVTTNSDGSVTTPVPYGTHTYKGSVSGNSFTRTVTKDTTVVYVMPDGALYWYGNECTDVTGGWISISNSGNDSVCFDINKMTIKSYDNDNSVVPTTVNKLNVLAKTYKARFSQSSFNSGNRIEAGIATADSSPAPKAVYYTYTLSTIVSFYNNKTSCPDDTVLEYEAKCSTEKNTYIVFFNLNGMDNVLRTTNLYALWQE